MKLLTDFFPLLLFFAAYKFWGIQVATATAVAASVLQVLCMRLRRQPMRAMHWFSFGSIVLLGGATLVTQNEAFIKWKPTVVFWLMGLALILGQVIWKKNLLRSMLAEARVSLPESAWQRLVWAWGGFFTALGALNLYVARHFDTDTWANFKVFGYTGLLLVFALAQGIYMARILMAQEAREKAAAGPVALAATDD